MFKFLKEKLKAAVSRISSAIEKEEPVAEEMQASPQIESSEVFTKEEESRIEVPPPPVEEEEIIEEKAEIKHVEKIPEKPKHIELPKKKEEIKEVKPLSVKKKETPLGSKGLVPPPIPPESDPLNVVRDTFKYLEEQRKKEAVREEPVKEAPKEFIQEQKQGFFAKLKQAITTTKISSEKFDELFWELEVAMLENNVAFEVIEKIKSDLKLNLVEKPIHRGSIEEAIESSLRNSVGELFDCTDNISLLNKIKAKIQKPYVVCFLGANGSGKTTTIAKITYLLQNKGLKCVLAAGDTWRSAAIQQLEEHAKRLNTPIVKHDYGADPAAIAFDAIEMAKARGIDVVLIDTAGRQHSNANLMDEMKKIVRVAKPDLKIYIGEMIAGNDCIEQIQSFDAAVGIDGVILSKADIDEKGGTAISVTYVTKKPILYLGMGQEYKDLEEFDKEKILNNLGL
ncbi:MAG: signal recognition particle-docking protein FtsY [Candidatus Nanoarchaeia archaeon]|jgi:fused signal recognition particle receptor